MKSIFLFILLICSLGTTANDTIDSETMSGVDYNVMNDSEFAIKFDDERIQIDSLVDDSLERHIVEQLVQNTEKIIEEKDAEKLNRTIVSTLILIFVLLSIWNRKQKDKKNG
jgi:hypothetical protein